MSRRVYRCFGCDHRVKQADLVPTCPKCQSDITTWIPVAPEPEPHRPTVRRQNKYGGK